MCEVRCWRWLFGNKTPISKTQTLNQALESEEELARRAQALQRAEHAADKAAGEVSMKTETVRDEYQHKLDQVSCLPL